MNKETFENIVYETNEFGEHEIQILAGHIAKNDVRFTVEGAYSDYRCVIDSKLISVSSDSLLLEIGTGSLGDSFEKSRAEINWLYDVCQIIQNKLIKEETTHE